jgi:hypothetical protein
MKTFAKLWALLPALLMCSLGCGDDTPASAPVSGTLNISALTTTLSRQEGENQVVERTVTFQMVPNSGADGFDGTAVAQEYIVRLGGGPTPMFQSWAKMTFTGKVIVGGRAYDGTLEQVVVSEGALDPNLPVYDPRQRPLRIEGEWFITQATGELKDFQGQGTLLLDGNDPSFTFNYRGEVSF